MTPTCGPRRLTGYRQARDARFFAPDGVPIVFFSPSDPAVGRAADERVAVDDLRDATEILVILRARPGISSIAIHRDNAVHRNRKQLGSAR